MFFGKKDKDVRLTDMQYKDLTSKMSKKERREFDRRQDELRREREEDRLLGWLEFEDRLYEMSPTEINWILNGKADESIFERGFDDTGVEKLVELYKSISDVKVREIALRQLGLLTKI